MKWLFSAMVAAIACSLSAQADVSASERQQQLAKLLEDISSPNPAVRIATFEAALSSKDRTVRRIAIEQGLNSSDQIMRETALLHAIAPRSSIMISVEPQKDAKPWEVAAAAAVGHRLEVYIFGFDLDTGIFFAATPYTSGHRNNDRSPLQYNAQQSALAGDRLSFSFDTIASYGTQPDWEFEAPHRTLPAKTSDYRIKSCTGNLQLTSGAMMEGSLACNSGSTSFDFKATLNALN